jgi:tetratricopeptide (TPR) repeat protein
MKPNGRWMMILFLVITSAAFLAAQGLERGEQLYKDGQYAQAETALREVIAGEPDNANAHLLLGMTLLELSKPDEAEMELKQAEGEGVEPDRLNVAQARLHIERQQMDQALAKLNEAHGQNANNPDVYYYRGLVRANRKDFSGAVADLEKAIEMTPAKAMAHYYAGLAYNGLKRPDKMVEHFQTFLKLAPDAPEAARVRSLLRSVR